MLKKRIILAAGGLGVVFAGMLTAVPLEEAISGRVEEHTILDKVKYGEVQGDIQTDKGRFRISGLTFKTDEPDLIGSNITERLTLGETFCMETRKDSVLRSIIRGLSAQEYEQNRPEFYVFLVKDARPAVKCEF